MKKYMMGAAALLAIAAPAVAHADDAGSLGVHYSNIDPDASGADSVDTYGLDLAFVHALDKPPAPGPKLRSLLRRLPAWQK